MKILLINIFPKKYQPTLGLLPPGHEATDTGFACAPVSGVHGHHHSVQYPHRGGGGDSAEGTQNFQKGMQAPPPPWGRVSRALHPPLQTPKWVKTR